MGVRAGSCWKPLPLTCHLAPATSPGGALGTSSQRLPVTIQLPLPFHAGTPTPCVAPLMSPVGISPLSPGKNSTNPVLVSLVGSVLDSQGQKDMKALGPTLQRGWTPFPLPSSWLWWVYLSLEDPLSVQDKEKWGMMESPGCRGREDRNRSLCLPHHPVGSGPWCPDPLLQHEGKATYPTGQAWRRPPAGTPAEGPADTRPTICG